MNKQIENLPVPQATSPLAQWLDYLEKLHTKTIDLGLERVCNVAKDMNLLFPATWVITVGGTNGKGTTCRLLEAILLASGLRVGVYSSPHLLSYTERVRIHGGELPEATHSQSMEMIEVGRGDTSLSYFEFGTLAALQLFKQAALDVVILEVGLGGRLDATNIVNADVAVITCIALDHTDWLGANRECIAREKAGIFRRGKPAVVGDPDLPTTIESAAAESGAKLYARNRNWWWQAEGHHWHWWDSGRELTALPLPLPAIPLENAGTALAAVFQFPFSVPEAAVHQGLRAAALPGRFQCIGHMPLKILDVAHNPHAAGYLARRLELLPRSGKIFAVVGMLADKDIAGTLTCLRKQIDVWYCATMDCPRASSAAQLAQLTFDSTAQRFANVISAWHQAIADARPDDCILVFGSFHTVASVMALYQN